MVRSEQAVNDQRWKLYRELVERAWADPDFLAELKKDPEGVLEREIKAARLDIPVGDIKLVFDTDRVSYFCIHSGGVPTC